MTDTPTYRIWQCMKSRCYNTNLSQYRHYGGRGIAVCGRWKDSFENFYNDMGERPSPEYSLDRVDNEDNYSPINCRWATRDEQANNRSNNALITHAGITLNVMQWAKKTGIQAATIYARVKSKWPADKILSTNNHNFNIVPTEDK